MLILGLLFVAAAVAAALGAAFLIDGGQNLEVADIGVSPFTLYLLGVASLLALVIGLLLMRSGARRSVQSRRERKELRRTQAKLREVEAERSGGAGAAATGTGPDPAAAAGQAPPASGQPAPPATQPANTPPPPADGGNDRA
jgi:hypothetical protein